MKWSEVFIVDFLEEYFNIGYSRQFQGRMPFDEELRVKSQKLFIEAVLSQLEPFVCVKSCDGARYYECAGVKSTLGLMYDDLEDSYANRGFGEMVEP